MFAGTLVNERAYPDSHWLELAADTERPVFAMVLDQRWMGMAAGRWIDREQGVAALWGMWVDPMVRGRALGRLLLAAVETWARDGGARRLRLGVIDGRGVEGFYMRLGFEPTGEIMALPRDHSLTASFFARPVASSSNS